MRWTDSLNDYYEKQEGDETNPRKLTATPERMVALDIIRMIDHALWVSLNLKLSYFVADIEGLVDCLRECKHCPGELH